MNTAELLAHLQARGFPEEAYSIGGDRNESYCLTREGDYWSVYYSERGRRNDEQLFRDEAEACTRLKTLLMNDSMVRRKLAE